MGWGVSYWGGSPWEGSDAPASSQQSEDASVTFDCQKYSVSDGINNPGVLTATTSMSGQMKNIWIVDSSFGATTDISGAFARPVVITSGVLGAVTGIAGGMWSMPSTNPWVWTSRVGHLNFDLDDSGEASRHIMPFSGVIHKILRLTTSVVVYGDNGIVRMSPQGVYWAKAHIHKVGIKGPGAVCGSIAKHYFIDKLGYLYVLIPDGAPEKVDYSNYFSSMSNSLMMSYDPRDGSVYITDGTSGYALTNWGLGECPPMITGVGYRDGTFYTSAATTITNSPFEITTDVIDMGTPTEKVITRLDIGARTTEQLYASIDYRYERGASWSSTSWTKVKDGKAFFSVAGVEFRIKLKLTAKADVQVDYLNVVGYHIPIMGGVASGNQ